MPEPAATSSDLGFGLKDLFNPQSVSSREQLVTSTLFSRTRADLPFGTTVLRDDFPEAGGATCLFVRVPPAQDRPDSVRFAVGGAYRVASCAAGGWLLKALDAAQSSYWIPQAPSLRSVDQHDRIVQEKAADLTEFGASADGMAFTVEVPQGLNLDFAIWQIPPEAAGLCSELLTLNNLERQKTFLWSSKQTYRLPAGLYLHLVNGYIYQSSLAWPRKWKFCCELDAYEIFVWLTGLQRATGKHLYNLLCRQIVLSVIARQSADGGWYHGEWTDMNECHYRFHNGAVLLLENAFAEWPDESIAEALRKGVEFVASKTDKTDLGLWFLHDSLEDSAEMLDEMHRQTGALVKGHGAWKPSRMFGKSPTNKMILNTHLDTTVCLDRYRELSGDSRFAESVDSAREATGKLLALRPAEFLYRAVYWAVGLAQLPADEAARLSIPLKAVKRLADDFLRPNVYRLKRLYPRIVMPGGLIDRHLAPLHFDTTYLAVNVLDLVRHTRRFPQDGLDQVLENAVQFIVDRDNARVRWWAERKPRYFSIVVFAEALFQLCLTRPTPPYRSWLAKTILVIEDLGLGLPPSMLGGNQEAVPLQSQWPCPSPADRRLRVANLSRAGYIELLVVNPTAEAIEARWETPIGEPLEWAIGAEGKALDVSSRLRVPPRGWLWARPAALTLVSRQA